MNEKGVFSYIFVFLIISLIFIAVFIVINPAMQMFITKSYKAAEPLINDANATAGSLSNANIKNSIQNSLNEQAESTTSQVEILGFFFKNAWLILIFIILIILFMLARQNIEAQQQGVY